MFEYNLKVRKIAWQEGGVDLPPFIAKAIEDSGVRIIVADTSGVPSYSHVDKAIIVCKEFKPELGGIYVPQEKVMDSFWIVMAHECGHIHQSIEDVMDMSKRFDLEVDAWERAATLWAYAGAPYDIELWDSLRSQALAGYQREYQELLKCGAVFEAFIHGVDVVELRYTAVGDLFLGHKAAVYISGVVSYLGSIDACKRRYNKLKKRFTYRRPFIAYLRGFMLGVKLGVQQAKNLSKT